MSSTQHRAFNNRRDELVTGIQHSVNTFADKCHGKRLITEETYDNVTGCEKNNNNKARQLLRNISVEIQENPKQFDCLLEVLKDTSCDVGEKLCKEWNGLEDRKTIQQLEEGEDCSDSTTTGSVWHQEPSVRRRIGGQEQQVTRERCNNIASSSCGRAEASIDDTNQPSNNDILVVGKEMTIIPNIEDNITEILDSSINSQ